MKKKIYPCFICEKRYAEMEEAEVCEQSHARDENPRKRDDDDGVRYADPRDHRDGRE